MSVGDMVDMFCLLVSPTHGDELQGIKRGVMELTDLVIVTKSDGDLAPKARVTRHEHQSALNYFRPRYTNWRPKVISCSAHQGDGMDDLWRTMLEFWERMSRSGELIGVRREQLRKWMWQHLEDELMDTVRKHPHVRAMVPKLEREIQNGAYTPGRAAETMLRAFLSNLNG